MKNGHKLRLPELFRGTDLFLSLVLNTSVNLHELFFGSYGFERLLPQVDLNSHTSTSPREQPRYSRIGDLSVWIFNAWREILRDVSRLTNTPCFLLCWDSSEAETH